MEPQQLLLAMASPANEERRLAETTYTQVCLIAPAGRERAPPAGSTPLHSRPSGCCQSLEQDPQSTAMVLMGCVADAHAAELARNMATVLLRHILDDSRPHWARLAPEVAALSSTN